MQWLFDYIWEYQVGINEGDIFTLKSSGFKWRAPETKDKLVRTNLTKKFLQILGDEIGLRRN